jgi:2-keto-3-deoxy-L-rhamnonate aldolase RhmA
MKDFNTDDFARRVKDRWNDKEEEVREKVEETIERRAREKAAEILDRESRELRKGSTA